MGILGLASASQTVSVATEVALVNNPINELTVPAGAKVSISGVVSCAAGTGGTTVALKVRQGVGASGTQVGATLTGPAQTANAAQVVPFEVIDTAPPANGVYTVTLTFTGNSSSVVVSTIKVLVDSGPVA